MNELGEPLPSYYRDYVIEIYRVRVNEWNVYEKKKASLFNYNVKDFFRSVLGLKVSGRSLRHPDRCTLTQFIEKHEFR
jgi:hypothetical protein